MGSTPAMGSIWLLANLDPVEASALLWLVNFERGGVTVRLAI